MIIINLMMMMILGIVGLGMMMMNLTKAGTLITVFATTMKVTELKMMKRGTTNSSDKENKHVVRVSDGTMK